MAIEEPFAIFFQCSVMGVIIIKQTSHRAFKVHVQPRTMNHFKTHELRARSPKKNSFITYLHDQTRQKSCGRSSTLLYVLCPNSCVCSKVNTVFLAVEYTSRLFSRPSRSLIPSPRMDSRLLVCKVGSTNNVSNHCSKRPLPCVNYRAPLPASHDAATTAIFSSNGLPLKCFRCG